jgi:hypothetical protein
MEDRGLRMASSDPPFSILVNNKVYYDRYGTV